MKKALITGHMGFVGRHMTTKLIELDYLVYGIDIKNGEDCRDFFKTNNDYYDLVVHLAAVVGGRDSIDNNPLSVATNLSIDTDMFNWAVKNKPKHVVYYSSSAAYPINLQISKRNLIESDINIDTDLVGKPDMTYGWAKLTGEYLASFAKKYYDLNVHILRPFSGYGPDQDITYPFPSFIQRIINKSDPFEIWGDGNQVRDFIHISDIIDATISMVDLNIQEPINLGTGRPISFTELAELMFSISKWKPKNGIIYKHDKPIGVSYRCSDNSKLLKFYTPKISLESGIKKALE